LEAARLEGLSEINCVVAEGLTEAQRKAFIIADNKLAENASWDDELLKLELLELQDSGFDLGAVGFELSELKKLQGGDAGATAEDDDFDIDAELENPSFSKMGDIWTLGRHRLICGDSTNSETICHPRLLSVLERREEVRLFRHGLPVQRPAAGNNSRHRH
jgi:hypothetical protein